MKEKQDFCPFIKKTCITTNCAIWMKYTKEDKTSVEMCAFVMNVMLQQQGICESIRTQASVDSFRNSLVDMGGAALSILAERKKEIGD